MAQSNLVTRVVTGLVGAPLIVLLLFLGPDWGWFTFVGAAALVAATELFAMTHPKDAVSRGFGVALSLGVYVLLLTRTGDARLLLTLVLVLPLVAMLFVLVRLGDIATAGLRIAALAYGPLYVGGGLGAVALLRRDGGADGPAFVVLALIFAWLSDTGAYFAGRAFGKHKLYEAVSPKKTVEGALGGLAGAAVGGAVASLTFLRSLPLPHAVALALVAGALGQAGDLGESLLKRSTGIKDSGGILPGHGGILDRIDALLVTATLTYLYVLFARG